MTHAPRVQDLAANPRGPALFQSGFRPFFLFGSLHGLLLVPCWTAMWTGWLPLPTWWTPVGWHVHEMLAGFVLAAASGFLLTAVPVWTQTSPLRGAPVIALFGLWLAGRAAFGADRALPTWLLLAIDGSYLPLLIALLGPRLLRSGATRHRVLLGALAGWAAVDLAFHAAALGWRPATPRELLHLPVHVIVLVTVLIGGRLIPHFTANALAARDPAVRVNDPSQVAVLSVVALLAALVLDAVGVLTGHETEEHAAALRLLAGCLLAVRLHAWRGLETLRSPLLWSLHLAFAWIPLGLWLEAASEGFPLISEVAGLHALGIGGFAGLILAVMSRVALGHTGRALEPPPPMTLAYLALAASACVRIAGVLTPTWTRASLWCAALLWVVALTTFLACYARALCSPRVDGQPG